jgi:hypothetical protein
MSVVGIDFGNYKSVIAVARNRGIDIVVNEVSNRFTPYVPFAACRAVHGAHRALNNCIVCLPCRLGRWSGSPVGSACWASRRRHRR